MAQWSSLTTNWAVTSEHGPRGYAVDSIGHHHAASTSLLAVLQAAQPGGRDVSMNYVIYRDQIWGVVPEDRRAFTSADSWADGHSITYEIINSSGGPYWWFDPVTLDTVMRLDADIMVRLGVMPRHALPGFWEHRNLWEWFGRSYPTACAGPSFYINQIIAGAVAKTKPVKELKVRTLKYTDNRHTDLKPGEFTLLKNIPGAPQDISGGYEGVFAFAIHVYANGTPGEVVELRLGFRDRVTKYESPHFIERLVFDQEGLINASRPFMRKTSDAVVVNVGSVKTNTDPLQITLIDADVQQYVEV